MFITVNNKPSPWESITLSLVAFVFLAGAFVWGMNILNINWIVIPPVWIFLVCLLLVILCIAMLGRSKLGTLRYHLEKDTISVNDSNWVPLSEIKFKSTVEHIPFAETLPMSNIYLTVENETVSLSDNKALAFGLKGYSDSEKVVFRKIANQNSFSAEDKTSYLKWLERVESVG